MTTRQHRSLLAFLIFVGVIATALALTSFYRLGVAHADTTVSPIGQSVTMADDGWEMIEAYGPIWGGMLIGFGLASAFLKRNAKEHWLAEGRKLAIVTALVGVLGSVIEARLGGATWAGVVVTVIGALKLVLSPTTKAS